MSSDVRIQICGRVAVRLDGARVEDRLPRRQGKLLFAYLVVHRLHAVTRTELVDALWPEGPPPAPDTALRALLSKLRHALAPGLLTAGADPQLTLPPDAFIDLEAAQEGLHRAASAVARGEPTAAWAPARVALHTADRGFLPGEEAPWIDAVRRSLADLRLDALECIAAVGMALGGAEVAATERSARRLVELEPLRESGWLWLMRAHVARGNPSQALLAYERLRVLLREEVGTMPGRALQELHAQLLVPAGSP